MRPDFVCLGTRFQAAAAEFPDRIAIVDGQHRLSYRELFDRADALVAELVARRIGPGDLVGVALPRSAELVVALVGIVRAGAAYVPVDLSQPAERRNLILSDACPQLVVTGLTPLDGLPADTAVLALPQHLPAGLEARPRPSPSDPAYVIYTSGSTGRPKGVVVTQENVARLFAVTQRHFNFGASDVWTLFHSIGFDVSVWEMWGALVHGGRLVIVPATTARAADAFHALVMQEGVTVLCQTPSAFRAFDMADAAAGRPENRLRHIVLAGEALDPRSLRGWIESHGDDRPNLVNMYGTTETTVHATYRRMLAEDASGPGTSYVGVPLDDLRLELVGPDGREVATGEIGEIFIGGAGVSTGYLGRPELTAERFVLDPRSDLAGARRYRTGDLGRNAPGGDLEFLGRIDEQVKLRGYRIELGEIEAVLRRAEPVRDAVVVLRENPVTGPHLIAYIVQDDPAPIDIEALRQHAAQHLPDYMLPAAYVRIDRVPRTINDKIDRAALPALTAADRASQKGGDPLRDDIEAMVARIFSEALGTNLTERNADFFRLGGDSLLAMRVAIRCQERLNVLVSASAIFDNPTVAALADFVRQEAKHTAKRLPSIARDHPVPLSPQQYALWLDVKLRADTNAYNEAIAFRVAALLEPDRVSRALVRLAEAHEVLRARVIEIEGEPRLVFDRSAAAIEFDFSKADNPVAAEHELAEARHRPLALGPGPFWRGILRHQADGGSLLLLVVHHLILDAASEKILLRDFITAYANPGSPLRRRAYDFVDLAAHEHACVAAEREKLERFWSGNLAGAAMTPTLPAPCIPCTPQEDDLACTVRREIAPDLSRRIRERAASWGSTPFHLYLAAYLALLRTYVGSDDIVVGSPVSLRDTPAAESVVGYLLNVLPLRVRLPGDRSFRKTVDEIARGWQAVRTHARLPAHLVLKAAQGVERTAIGSPVQVLFSLDHDPGESLAIDGHSLERVHIAPAIAKFNLFLLVRERGPAASLELEFRRGTFDRDMGDRFLGHFEVLLRAASESPDKALAELPLADEAEMARLRACEGHRSDYPRDRTITNLFEEVVRERKGQTALVQGSERISYEALDARANAIAATLSSAGVRKGDRVPLLLPRGVRFIACALAVMKCGAAYVPLDPSYPPERLRRMLAGLGARTGIGAQQSAACAEDLQWLDPEVADRPTAADAPGREIEAQDAAYVMFTSGSTGRPKGVEIPHRAVVRLVFGQDFARMGPDDTWLHMAPTSFDASTLEIWAPLLHGGCCVILEEVVPTPGILSEIILRESVTSAWITASLFNALVDEAPFCLTGLKQILVGGEVLSPSHIRRAYDHLPGVRLVNGYGPTENTTFTCCHLIQHQDVEPGRTVPIGRPIAHTTVHVLDPDGRRVPVGIPGELVAGGDGVALGYVGDRGDADQRFTADRFSGEPEARLYRSGDRVRWLPDGTLAFLGRFDDQVKIRGHRIEPGEIVACLSEHDLVAQAAVAAKRAAAGAAQLIAYVVPRGAHDTVELRNCLRAHLARCLPSYMIPASLVFLSELPLKPSGKLDIELLKEFEARRPPERNEPLNTVEGRVLKVFREVLRNPQLGPDDDFLESGGDSLQAVQILFQIEATFGKQPPPHSMMGSISARRLAGCLPQPTAALPQYSPGLVEVRAGASQRILFCIPGLAGHAFQYYAFAKNLKTAHSIRIIELHNLDVELSVFDSINETAKAVIHCMRQAQPHGPYALLGHSYGGNLVVEVARLLMAEKEAVDLAVVLDAQARAADDLRRAYFTNKPNVLKRAHDHLRIIRELTPQQAFAYIFSRVRGRLSPTLYSTSQHRIAAICERAIGALESYRPAAFPGRIALVRANNPTGTGDPSMARGWDLVCEGGVEVISIACGHQDIVKEPYVRKLAAYVAGLLNGIDECR